MLNKLLRRVFRVGLIMSLGVAASCGTNGSGPATAPDNGTSSAAVVTPPASPTPAPPPAVTPAPSPSLSGEVAIADNFDASTGLEPTWYGPNGRGGIAPESPDPVGAFRFMCTSGQIAKDDPIVYPGQSGASHLHQFWGNTGTNANSNYQSLRTTGGSTCDNRSAGNMAINRSAYWSPAMLDGAGHVVKPDFINTYYKQIPHGDPTCQGPPSPNSLGWCVDLPNGIHFVFGYNMANGKGGPADASSWDPSFIWYNCWDDLVGTPNARANGTYHTIAEVVAAGCPAGAVLVAQAIIPACWDGKNLDSADHRSHMAVPSGDYIPSIGQRACPSDHPYVLPGLQMRVHYTTDDNFVAGKWHLSSDEMMPGTVAGSTLHFDYFEAWSPTVKDLWFRNCIDKHQTCAQGDLGTGMQIKEAGVPSEGWPRHQLVPVP